MNRRARTPIATAALAGLLISLAAVANGAAQPAPQPLVTAENTPWFLAGEPITFAGNIYYPAGPQVFFNRFEMIRSGFYEGVPLYTRTTIEPFSAVFVPVGGGLMQPYERRRAGDVAGTAGSTTPSFPIVTPAEQETTDRSLDPLPQAAAPPTRVAASIGDTSRELTEVTPGSGQGFDRPAAAPVGTTGPVAVAAAEAPAMPTGPLRSAQLPEGLNGVFIEYGDRRWFSSGPAVEISATRLVRVGEYHGFPVYAQPGATDKIYVASTTGEPVLLAPYSVRR